VPAPSSSCSEARPGTAAVSRLAIAAVLRHILGHGLAKTVLLLGSGRTFRLTGSRSIADVRALAAREPALAGLLGLGLLAPLGFPPFSVFASELGIFRGGFSTGTGAATGIALMLVITGALFSHAGPFLLGNPPKPAIVDSPGTATASNRTAHSTVVALGCGLVVCDVLGVAAGPLPHLLALAADVLMGTP
jgi:hydrogenase-4 component F